ncbi:MAG: DUF6544 family protein [Salinibacter sp.]|uniref:DUF6920 family protein n=1 Tax=Salinibacter sp. TaxID=2065818 RepID=UPI002FC2B476
MWTPLLFTTLGVIVAGLGGAIYVGRQQLDRKNRAVVDDLLAAAEAPPYRAVRTIDLDDLPAPIQRYLRHVLSPDQPLVRAGRLEQTGKRPVLTDDGTCEERPRKGTRRNYERRNGLRVPTDGDVTWIHPEGAVAYCRGHIESIDYRLTDRDDVDARRTSDPL